MPDEDIIKGLECCTKYSDMCGEGCPYYGYEKCFEDLLKDTLCLIKRLRSTSAILSLTDAEIGTVILQALRENLDFKGGNQNENN